MPAEAEYIRQFQPADAEACSRLIRACLIRDSVVAESARQNVLSSETPELMLERARNFYVAVCIAGDELVGLGAVDLNEIRLLFIAPEHRRRGMGRALLGHLEAWI